MTGPCSQSCGHGIQEYKRTKLHESENGGLDCVGSFQKTESCYIQDCPVDCQWSAWSKEGECSRSCGGGKQIFIRTERIKAGNGGIPCYGSESKIETCNNHVCPGK